MVCGLFSSFDPTILTSMSKSKWFLMLLVFFLPLQTNPVKGLGIYFLSFFKFLNSLLSSSLESYKNPIVLMGTLFLVMLSFNLMGLIPYTFSLTSHLVVNLSLSLPLWMSAMIFSILYKIKGLIAHLVPLGSPLPLWPLLVIVESVSLLIRPWTLAIRLMANVMAGHLIMNLIGMGLCKVLSLAIPAVFVMSGFIFFEICVSLIQSYVFTSLLILYWSE